jgi:hypothetical protein
MTQSNSCCSCSGKRAYCFLHSAIADFDCDCDTIGWDVCNDGDAESESESESEAEEEGAIAFAKPLGSLLTVLSCFCVAHAIH